MTQKPMLRAEVGMRVRCANKASAEWFRREMGIGLISPRKTCKKRGACGAACVLICHTLYLRILYVILDAIFLMISQPKHPMTNMPLHLTHARLACVLYLVICLNGKCINISNYQLATQIPKSSSKREVDQLHMTALHISF